MNDNEMKVCSICRKSIDNLARKCPYCHHWQNKIVLAFNHPIGAMLPMFFGLALLSFFIKNMIGPGTSFSTYQKSIAIHDTRLEFGENSCGKNIVILGNIENKTDISWEQPRFEISVLDESGKIVDSEQDEVYDLLIPKNSTIPFKVVFSKQFSDELYENFKLKIMDAKEKDKFY